MKKKASKIIKLDEYERDIEENFDKHISLSAKEFTHEAALLKAAANNSLKKDKRITIRIYSHHR